MVWVAGGGCDGGYGKLVFCSFGRIKPGCIRSLATFVLHIAVLIFLNYAPAFVGAVGGQSSNNMCWEKATEFYFSVC